MASSSTKQALVDTLGSGRVDYESNKGVSAGQVSRCHRPLLPPSDNLPPLETLKSIAQAVRVDLKIIVMQGGVLIAYFVFLVLWIYAEVLERRKRYILTLKFGSSTKKATQRPAGNAGGG